MHICTEITNRDKQHIFWNLRWLKVHNWKSKKKYSMFSPGFEPGTFCVLDRCDNRYTTKTHWHLQIIQPWHAQPGSLLAECARPNITRNPIAVLSRDRLVVRTLRCGRSNPGSNPGHGMDKIFLIPLFKFYTKNNASAGNRTRINCLEGSYADHYTTDAYRQIRIL